MEIKEMPERRTAVVRVTVPVDQLPATVGAAFGEVMAYLGGTEASVAGPPFVLYHNEDMHALDVEMGFPVDREVPGQGRVRPSRIPGGRVLSAVHVGPYAELERSYAPLMQHMAEEGLKGTGWMYELYLNSPEDTPADALRTEICFPLDD